MTTWFTADTHFGHTNIINLCSRPFQSAEHMDSVLVANWNAKVAPNDEVIHLGDFAWKPAQMGGLRQRLNGKIRLVPGNHDRVDQLVAAGLVDEVLPPIYELRTPVEGGKLLLVLCHYPLAEWNRYFRGAIHLHGHCHGNMPTPDGMRRLDVGVDVHAFSPLRLEDVLRRFRGGQ